MIKITKGKLRDLILDGITTEELKQYDYSSVRNMSFLFSLCSNLKKVPWFDTSHVTNMKYMFSHCESLEEVPLFDTSNVINMASMFARCYNLRKLKMHIRKDCNIHNFIGHCYSLSEVDFNIDVDLEQTQSPFLKEKYPEYFI